MSKELSLWGPVTADTTPEVVYTNSPGDVVVLESMTLANPSSGVLTTVVLSLIVDDAATRVIEYPVPAGAGSYVVYPMLRLVDANQLLLSSTVSDDVVVTTGNGYAESAPFSPLLVPEVAAGYFWDAEVGVVALGSSTFRWTERGGKSAADQVQTTLSRQPSIIQLNGHAQLRWDKSTTLGGAGTKTASVSTVTAGWSGATYICGWWRTNGSLTALTNALFQHGGPNAPLLRITLISLTATAIRLVVSTDGTATETVDFPIPTADVAHFIEVVFNPAAASGARAELWIDRVKQTIVSGGITITSLADTSSRISVTDRTATTEHGYVTDCGWCAYANGIPNDFNRDQLYNFKRAA